MADINTGSMHQSIIKSFDEATESLKTTIVNAEVAIDVSAVADSIAIADQLGNKVTTTEVGAKRALDVNVTDISLSHTSDSVEARPAEEIVYIDEGSGVSYFGFAAPGSSTASAVWKIKKLTESGGSTTVQYADGNSSYDNVWANRARAPATMSVGARPSAADIADAVWRRNLAPFPDVGTAGKALTDAGSAGNPRAADIASNNSPGTFGEYVQKLLTTAKFLGLK